MSKKEIVTNIDHGLAKKFKEAEKRKVSIKDFITDFINQFISEQVLLFRF